jgi:undecaprenyl-phosphate 4-deoxy-4-formamido-L-arabinose transferase
VAIAVHRSAPTLERLVREVLDAVGSTGATAELVLVDDASTDGSWEAIATLARTHDEVRGLRLSTNVGEDRASRCAIGETTGDVVVTLDDDLQQPPADLVRLLGALGPDVDVAYGVPDRLAHGAARRLATRLWKALLVRVAAVPGGVAPTSFRAFRGELRAAIDADGAPIDVALARTGPTVVAVAVGHQARVAGRTGYTWRALVGHARAQLVGYEVPARTAVVRLLRRPRAPQPAAQPRPAPPPAPVAERTSTDPAR